MTTAAAPDIVPQDRPYRICPSWPPPTGAWPSSLEVGPVRQHPPDLRYPGAGCSTTGALRWGSRSLPADPLTVARYLAARAGSGASVATLRLAASAIAKAHEWAKLESPCRDPDVRASPEEMGPTPGQAPAPVRGTHRRRPGHHPPHRRPAPQARTGHRDARAGGGAGQV